MKYAKFIVEKYLKINGPQILRNVRIPEAEIDRTKSTKAEIGGYHIA